ncbi:MAG TPA: M15 family metallopeptidase, partial [Cyclobacteriaceae bacterium]
RHLLTVGFFSLELDVVNSILEQKIGVNSNTVYVNWGGHYTNTKDYMHFELRPTSARAFQINVHALDIQTIKTYLNSFEKRNGGVYEY